MGTIIPSGSDTVDNLYILTKRILPFITCDTMSQHLLCTNRISLLLRCIRHTWTFHPTCNQTHLQICDHFNSLRAHDPVGRRGLLSILTRLPKLDVRPNLACSVRPKLIKLVLWECFHTTSMSTQIQLRIPGPVSLLWYLHSNRDN